MHLPMTCRLYCDGGVISKNPSTIGGTYACRIVDSDDETVLVEIKGIVIPSSFGVTAITNNHTEMMAIITGLSYLPLEFDGTVFSDSLVTLNRVFSGWAMKNVPPILVDALRQEQSRLKLSKSTKWSHLAGHPTREQLTRHFGKNGSPISIHQVWCDMACGEMAKLPSIKELQQVSVCSKNFSPTFSLGSL